MTGNTLLYVAGENPADTDVVNILHDELGTRLHTASSIATATDALQAAEPDCVITEYQLPDGTGLELLAQVRGNTPDTGCILFTTVNRDAIDTTAFGDILPEYVNKTHPDAIDRLVRIVRTTLTAHSHTGYPLPDDEPSRLETLASLDLDADSLQASLKQITARAADRFDVPLTSVGVISAHAQDFLVTHGADWTTIPREDTVCTYTILDDEVTVIEDLQDDLRFADNEAIAELDVRFYAGAPLRVGDRSPIGTLCLYDYEPRSFSEADRQALQALADDVADAITAHARQDAIDGTGQSSPSTDEQ